MTLLSLHRISKTFGNTIALDNVSFDVAAGEVHALLGENGAGKSTLMRIAYGLLRPDSGESFASPVEARAAGIGMVHQHFTSIPAFTVAENIALTAGWRDTGKQAEARAAVVIERAGLPLDPAVPASALSVQLRQRLEIVKALAADARVLLLDEPSAVLAPREVQELLATIRDFAARGGAVVLITHKLDEVFAAADRVTVLRRGVVTFSGPIDGETHATLAQAMLGSELPRTVREAATPGEVVVRATGLVIGKAPPQSFELRAGEVVGMAAIEGNGQRELLRAVAGVIPARGEMQVTGPVSFVPEDRTREGVILDFSLTENLLLGLLHRAGRWIDWPHWRTRMTELLARFDIRADSVDLTAAQLSGGNQQKLVFARAFERGPRVLVAEDPTRGLDILATHAIHQRLREAAKGGAAVLVHSSDLDEVLEIADRVLVMRDGIMTEMPRDATRDQIGDALLGVSR